MNIIQLVEPLIKGHFWSSLFVLYTEVVLARSEVKSHYSHMFGASYVSIIRRLSLAWRVLKLSEIPLYYVAHNTLVCACTRI